MAKMGDENVEGSCIYQWKSECSSEDGLFPVSDPL